YVPSASISAGCVQTRCKAPLVLLPTGATDYGDTKALVGRLRDYVKRWVTCPDDVSLEYALAYILMTWLIENFDAIAYYRAIGDWGSGKTRLITVVGSVCQRPIFVTGGTTPAALFRLINRWRGSLLIDEGDFNAKTPMGELLEQVKLTGYKRPFSIARCE